MARKSSTRAGFREVMAMRIRHGSMHGAVWAMAPLDVTWFGPLDHHGRKADERDAQLETALAGAEDVELLVLAGEQYRTFLARCAWPARVPMAGMGIGQQLGYLTEEIRGFRTAG